GNVREGNNATRRRPIQRLKCGHQSHKLEIKHIGREYRGAIGGKSGCPRKTKLKVRSRRRRQTLPVQAVDAEAIVETTISLLIASAALNEQFGTDRADRGVAGGIVVIRIKKHV